MEEPDFDVKKEKILSKLDLGISMLDMLGKSQNLLEYTDSIKMVLLDAEKDVKEY